MDTIQTVVLVAHTVIALGIIALVLLQRGKGADAGAAFGAGASGTVFGARGSGSFFSRATAILATAFFASSLTLAYMSSQRTTSPQSVLDRADVEAVVEDPASATTPAADGTELPALEEAVEEAGEAISDELPSLDEGVEEAPQ